MNVCSFDQKFHEKNECSFLLSGKAIDDPLYCESVPMQAIREGPRPSAEAVTESWLCLAARLWPSARAQGAAQNI